MPELEIRLNGESFRVEEGSTVADLLRRLELPADRVAVELDRSIVRRAEWASRRLEAGAAVEVVQVVGGG
jgi:thiamine biosynthesis protein ThiS